jgi:hypothetical protein
MNEPATIHGPCPSRDRRVTRALILAATCAAIIAMLGACGGGDADEPDGTTLDAGRKADSGAAPCLVKRTPPGETHDPLPTACMRG